METKVGRSHAKRIRVSLGFDGIFYVDNNGLSGGLALLWRKNNTARLMSFSKNHINVELPMNGYQFTWEKGKGTANWIEERLDKVLATQGWCVKSALFAMFPDKASSPDGMNPGFYQHLWDVNIPELVTDLRPIALSNVVYMNMAKMITNRMKPMMGNIILDSQSAFMPDKLITDNILIAAEVGYYLNRKQCAVVGWGALKLDMAKAYDRMEWPFLQGMLVALGFNETWIKLIMLCVSSAQNDGLIHGCRVARGAPPISQLFFADDSLLFFKANRHEANEVKNCLSTYEAFSGQVVKYHKSSICYSRNTSIEDRDEVAQILQITQAPNFGKYLGLPSFVRRNKKAAFAYIDDKIKQIRGLVRGVKSCYRKLVRKSC
ncbi:PREDICTED: uncharacterized protein LOC109166631 [Ipomoea nil]|uniref:uncharacterized protein LOC109166631 n=1 Tax=Ipomoea nil TaxID=35883 RepID=UPI000901355E|nr:PREDICTED: uncharacterized protein LOC109166631 [Ipomoea nil]